MRALTATVLRALLLLALFLGSCGGWDGSFWYDAGLDLDSGEGSDTDVDTDADTDADSDTDADTDTDTDSDAGADAGPDSAALP
ncbi:MAG: hypothetical protein M0R80_24715 [Proteobacteria bacterium]|nr:hypothetical protein [Pseudomonadota bacterium]